MMFSLQYPHYGHLGRDTDSKLQNYAKISHAADEKHPFFVISVQNVSNAAYIGGKLSSVW